MPGFDSPRIALGIKEGTPRLAKQASQGSEVLHLGETQAACGLALA